MKTAERECARKLRREEGRSVKELASLLGVARSSISLWVRDIELTDEQRANLRRRMGGRIDGPRVNVVRHWSAVGKSRGLAGGLPVRAM
jgi:transposase